MNPIALITGGNRGVGLEICRQLANQGQTVILTSRDFDKGQHAAERLRQQSATIVYHQLDVTDNHSIEKLRAFVYNEFGRVDVLVNNAGVYPDQGVSVLDITNDTLRQALEVNAIGAWAMCRALVPLMIESNYGRVVNVSSGLGAITGMGGYSAAYKISKVALNALTRIIAQEVRPYNIKVNAMCPGWVRTEMGGPAAPRTVEEGADTAVWLATLPDNGPTNGFFRDRQPINW
jgi:NAD(P)-dependent dehydrogenase (short-subunit alcohol dehydrogenase family)